MVDKLNQQKLLNLATSWEVELL